MIKFLKISEMLWLVMAVLGLFYTPYHMYTYGVEASYIFMLATVMAAVMSFLRRRRRKSYEKREQEQ